MSQHFASYPGSTFACGADATGQRNSRLDQDPAVTTCERCKATDAWRAADVRANAPEPIVAFDYTPMTTEYGRALPIVSTAKYGQEAAEDAAPAQRFAVYGENTLTGNRWECVTDIATYAEAQQIRNGWARLESDYKIVYYAEPQA